MNVDECRNRAERCLAAAQNASAQDVKQSWQQLAQMWLTWSEQLERFRAYRKATTTIENEAELVPDEPINESIISRKGKIAEIADKLRLRLALLQ